MFDSKLSHVVSLILGLGLAACSTVSEPAEHSGGEVKVIASGQVTPEPTPTLITALDLPDLGQAPDITNEVWLNSAEPLNLATLHGRVVVVEFWTFG